MARLRRISKSSAAVSAAEAALYQRVEVGYNEDRLTWSDPADLLLQFERLVNVVSAPPLRINNKNEAENYFRGAERRPIKVFVSYAAEDRRIAEVVCVQLKRKCEVVFDYRDGESLTAGTGYPAQLYDRLAASDIGVPLLSENYLRSGSCAHEAQDMCASHDSGKMFIHPVNIDGCKPPSYFRSLQYDLLDSEHVDGELIVDRILRSYDTWNIDQGRET